MSVVYKLSLNQHLITHLAGAGNYAWVHHQDGQRKLYSRPLLYFETVFTDFIRVHKMVLVNPQFVEQWEFPKNHKKNGLVTLKGGLCFPVSRRRRKDIEPVAALSDLQPPIMDLQPSIMDLQPSIMDLQPPIMDLPPPVESVAPELVELPKNPYAWTNLFE